MYSASGTLPAAAFLTDGRGIVEHKLYWTRVDSELEGCYLLAILNSDTTHKHAEHLQSRGQWGAMRAYIAKDLGVSSIKDDVWMRRLAGWLGYSPNTAGIWKMAFDIQAFSKEKINVIDTVLWNWARTQH